MNNIVERFDKEKEELEEFFDNNKDLVQVVSRKDDMNASIKCSIYDFIVKKDFIRKDSNLKIPKKLKTMRFVLKVNVNTCSNKIDKKVNALWGLFHPHFTLVSDRESEWEDYKDSLNESTETFVRRVILSSLYTKKYIETSQASNKDATQWYSKILLNGKIKLPTDDNDFKSLDRNTEANTSEGNATKRFTILQQCDSSQGATTQEVGKSEENDTKRFIVHSPQETTAQEVVREKNNKKFLINEVSKGYSPSVKKFEKENYTIDKTLNSITKNNCANEKNVIYISTKAREQIWEHIHWRDQNNPKNRVEQGGILIGNVFIDEEQKIQYAIVEFAISGDSAKGNPAYLEMCHQTWKEMIDKAEKIIESENNNLHMIGWYHTHPNSLDVFMSGTDQNTQKLFFNQSWQYAIVLNPHKAIWRAFSGKDATECQGYFLAN